jgi:hypothetical protein
MVKGPVVLKGEKGESIATTGGDVLVPLRWFQEQAVF